MEIGSVSNGYIDLFQDITTSQVSEIKKAAIMEQLGIQLAIASDVANSICASFGGYEMDSVIPEDSTVSFHV